MKLLLNKNCKDSDAVVKWANYYKLGAYMDLLYKDEYPHVVEQLEAQKLKGPFLYTSTGRIVYGHFHILGYLKGFYQSEIKKVQATKKGSRPPGSGED